MRTALVKSLWGILLVILIAPVCGRAQFLGYTSPQTVNVLIFNQIIAPAASSPVQNIGQTVHIVAYTATLADTVEVVIQADMGGGVWQDISNTATAKASGLLYASGYYPKVRVNVKTLTGAGGPHISAWYSGTSTTVGPEAGAFRSSGTEISQVTINSSALVNVYNLSAPAVFRSTEGTVFFQPTGMTTTAATGAYLSVVSSLNPQSCTGVEIARFGPLTGGGVLQAFRVPAVAAGLVCINYDFAAAPAAGTYSIYYAFGSTTQANNVAYTFPVMAATGVTAGVAVQYAGVRTHTINLKPTATIATCTFTLEGSLDSTTGVDGTWTAISAAVDCSDPTKLLFHVQDKPVAWVRGNLSIFTGDGTARIQPYYLGVE